MTHRILLLIFLFQGLIIISPISAQKRLCFKWSVIAELPLQDSLGRQPGLAGAFVGISNNVLLIAGGANFPDAMPWNGGKKIYWDDIYILDKKDKTKYTWIESGEFKFNQRVAYGASVSTTEGVVCIGGENEKGILKNVFLMQWDAKHKKVIIKDLPELPIPLTNLCAVMNERIIYVAGGETGECVSDKFYLLDLQNTAAGWKQLPSIPKAVSHAVMVFDDKSPDKNIFLIGGRKKTVSGTSELYSSVFQFNILKNQWIEGKPLPYTLSAGAGIPNDSGNILLFGGDKGEIFHETEKLLAAINIEKDEGKKERLIQHKNRLQQSHPGFSNEVLLYDSEKDEWKTVGKIPFNTPATTTAVKWGSNVLIPSGEIKAGVRTRQILLGKIVYKK